MHARRESLDYNDLIQSLNQATGSFEQSFPLKDFEAGDYKQHPSYTLLICSDSRVPSNFLGDTFNRVFVIENIGNQVKTGEGSLLYGLLHLNTPVMVVAGHTDCGAIKAAAGDYNNEPASLRNELDIVRQSMEDARKQAVQFDAVDDELKYTRLAELNVDQQIRYLLEHEEIKQLVDNKSLLILGIMLDLHDHYQG
ncbi:MAG: carbonic anhydrase, partial [Syntrophomonadaceae bacterium]|nr:carbonic anhydrase [Syntrophomonadaceae bacterium]